MPDVLYVRLPEEDYAKIKAAAKAAGCSIAEFARTAALRAAADVSGERADDLHGMVREIRDRLLGAGGSDTESAAAVSGLVALGLDQAEAAKRVATITAGDASLEAGEIVRRAFQNGKE